MGQMGHTTHGTRRHAPLLAVVAPPARPAGHASHASVRRAQPPATPTRHKPTPRPQAQAARKSQPATHSPIEELPAPASPDLWPTLQKFLVTVDEAATLLSVGKPKVWQLVGSGVLPSIKLGGSRRILVAELRAFVLRVAADEQKGVNRW